MARRGARAGGDGGGAGLTVAETDVLDVWEATDFGADVDAAVLVDDAGAAVVGLDGCSHAATDATTDTAIDVTTKRHENELEVSFMAGTARRP